jgi:orotate phosphoribosyltransferase-like protein
MAGKNWNSKTKQHTDVVKLETIANAKKAVKLKEKGLTVAQISEEMGLSKSRIYEYLK